MPGSPHAPGHLVPHLGKFNSHLDGSGLGFHGRLFCTLPLVGEEKSEHGTRDNGSGPSK